MSIVNSANKCHTPLDVLSEYTTTKHHQFGYAVLEGTALDWGIQQANSQDVIAVYHPFPLRRYFGRRHSKLDGKANEMSETPIWHNSTSPPNHTIKRLLSPEDPDFDSHAFYTSVESPPNVRLVASDNILVCHV